MNIRKQPKVIFIMGVSGSGKSTIAKRLSKDLNVTYIEGDDHHPQSNIKKMTDGIPLTDQDRKPWLVNLNKIAEEYQEIGCVISCSALKRRYRKQLALSLEDKVVWIFLSGEYDLILDRMKKRENHFMDPKMLRSQFEALEEPEDAIVVDITESPTIIVNKIKDIL